MELVETRHLQNGIHLHFPPEDRETADLIEAACRRSVSVITDTWPLTPPKRCRVFIMTAWLRFLFQSAPCYLWIQYLLLLPFIGLRFRKTWRLAGGLTLRYRHNPAVGIKAPRLLALCDTSMGEMIFSKEPDLNKRMEHILCHELTHAFSAGLMLPLWLNEGIAMLAVDRYFAGTTVRPDSLQTLNNRHHKMKSGDYRKLPRMSKDAFVYHYVRGYWLTRFLSEAHPELLNEFLKKKYPYRAMERKIAVVLGMNYRSFWETIDERIIEHFEKRTHADESLGGANERQVS